MRPPWKLSSMFVAKEKREEESHSLEWSVVDNEEHVQWHANLLWWNFHYSNDLVTIFCIFYFHCFREPQKLYESKISWISRYFCIEINCVAVHANILLVFHSFEMHKCIAWWISTTHDHQKTILSAHRLKFHKGYIYAPQRKGIQEGCLHSQPHNQWKCKKHPGSVAPVSLLRVGCIAAAFECFLCTAIDTW